MKMKSSDNTSKFQDAPVRVDISTVERNTVFEVSENCSLLVWAAFRFSVRVSSTPLNFCWPQQKRGKSSFEGVGSRYSGGWQLGGRVGKGL